MTNAERETLQQILQNQITILSILGNNVPLNELELVSTHAMYLTKEKIKELQK